MEGVTVFNTLEKTDRTWSRLIAFIGHQREIKEIWTLDCNKAQRSFKARLPHRTLHW